MVLYANELDLEADDFARVLIDSGLGTTRPVDNRERLDAMLRGANVIVTARLDAGGAPLVGVLRGISDGAWCCYVAEVAVSRAAQGLGVGKGLLEKARESIGPAVSLILVSVPESVGFYDKIGMARLENAYWYRRVT